MTSLVEGKLKTQTDRTSEERNKEVVKGQVMTSVKVQAKRIMKREDERNWVATVSRERVEKYTDKKAGS